MSETPDDIAAWHEQRGDVKCEACGAWASEYIPTLDDVYLCIPCAKQSTEATPQEIANFLYGTPILTLMPEGPQEGAS